MSMNIGLIISGGTGVRFGGALPKQYLRAGGKMLISWAAEGLWRSGKLDALRIVAADSWREAILAELPSGCVFQGFSLPGASRQVSIFNALKDLSPLCGENDTVLIHDAARPLVSPELTAACYAALPGHDGVMPALPMTDTVYESAEGNRVEGLLDRSRIFAGQAPELFRFGPYWRANLALPPEALEKIRGSTEPALLAGLDVVMIPGSPENLKVTVKGDLERCVKLLEQRKFTQDLKA